MMKKPVEQANAETVSVVEFSAMRSEIKYKSNQQLTMQHQKIITRQQFPTSVHFQRSQSLCQCFALRILRLLLRSFNHSSSSSIAGSTMEHSRFHGSLPLFTILSSSPCLHTVCRQMLSALRSFSMVRVHDCLDRPGERLQ